MRQIDQYKSRVSKAAHKTIVTLTTDLKRKLVELVKSNSCLSLDRFRTGLIIFLRRLVEHVVNANEKVNGINEGDDNNYIRSD